MKKPMKFKRYDEGGEVADKEAGLKASKDEDVGFFQRLRMGNIDDPSSEAYKRFGAGRGRSERNPVGESVSVSGSQPVARPSMRPRPIERALSDDMYSDYGNIKGGKGTGTGEAGSSYYVGKKRPSDFPNIPPMAESSSTAMNKPVKAKPTSKAESGESVSVNEPKTTKKSESGTPDMRGVTEETRVARRSYNEPPVGYGRRDEENQTKAPIDETKLSLSERMKLSRERSKTGSGPTDRRSVSERIRSSMGMKSGGSVSSASRRADGIATKGKTRGKIC